MLQNRTFIKVNLKPPILRNLGTFCDARTLGEKCTDNMQFSKQEVRECSSHFWWGESLVKSWSEDDLTLASYLCGNRVCLDESACHISSFQSSHLHTSESERGKCLIVWPPNLPKSLLQFMEYVNL